MSTRSYIAEEIGNNKYKAIYCHSDGYLTYNGAMLVDFFNTREKLNELLNLGSISYLAPKVNPDPTLPHSFDYGERQDDVVLAYGRDRGEKGTEAKEMTLEQLTDESNWTEYVYIFDKNQRWLYCKTGAFEDSEMHDVREDLAKEYARFGLERPDGYYGFLDKEIANSLQAAKQSAPSYSQSL